MPRKQKEHNPNSEVYVARQLLSWSQQELADVMGVHWTTISRWENNHKRIPPASVRLIRMICRTHVKGQSAQAAVRRLEQVVTA